MYYGSSPQIAEHPGVILMHVTLQHTYYEPQRAADVTPAGRGCVQCAEIRVLLRKRASFMKVFPASEPLESVDIKFLGHFPKAGAASETSP